MTAELLVEVVKEPNPPPALSTRAPSSTDSRLLGPREPTDSEPRTLQTEPAPVAKAEFCTDVSCTPKPTEELSRRAPLSMRR